MGHIVLGFKITENEDNNIINYNTIHILLSAIDKGSWEIYTSYNYITEIEPAGNQVFALASNGLFLLSYKKWFSYYIRIPL